MLKKIKDAAERAKNQIENCFPVCNPEIETDPFEWAETVSVRVRSIMSNLDAILEALAALDAENPGEDAREVARIVHEECFVDISQTTSTPSRSLIWDIDTAAHVVKSFAASYHAAQCAKCKALPDPPYV